MASATAARTARTQETVADTLRGLWHEVPTGAALIVHSRAATNRSRSRRVRRADAANVLPIPPLIGVRCNAPAITLAITQDGDAMATTDGYAVVMHARPGADGAALTHVWVGLAS